MTELEDQLGPHSLYCEFVTASAAKTTVFCSDESGSGSSSHDQRTAELAPLQSELEIPAHIKHLLKNVRLSRLLPALPATAQAALPTLSVHLVFSQAVSMIVSVQAMNLAPAELTILPARLCVHYMLFRHGRRLMKILSDAAHFEQCLAKRSNSNSDWRYGRCAH